MPQRLPQRGPSEGTVCLGHTPFYDPPKLTFGTLKPSQGLAAPPAISFVTLRNCFLAPWNPPKAPKASQRLRHLLLWPSETAFGSLKPSFGLTAPPAVPQSLSNASEIASARSLRRHRVPWPHCLFMTLRNWLLAPSNPPKVSQRLPHLLLWPSETAFWSLQTLLRPRSASGILFYDPPQMPFGTLKPSFGLAAPPAVPQSLSNASEIASARSLRRHRVPWPHCLFMTLRNWLLAASNPPKVSQRLLHLLLWPSETAFWHLETLLRPRSALFYDPPKVLWMLKPSFGLAAPPAVPQSLSNASEIASARSLRRHRVPWPHCVFMTLRNWLLAPSNPPKVSQRLLHLLLWPSEAVFWSLQTLLRPRSASGIFFYDPPKLLLAAWNPPSASQRLQQSLRDCFGRPLTRWRRSRGIY